MSRTPDLGGFAEAQDRKRAQLGSDVTFLWPARVTFAPGTPISPETGRPFDPLVTGSAGTQPSASARCSVFMKAINRGGASNAEVDAPIGLDEKTRLFLNVASADGLTIRGEGPRAPAQASGAATEFIFHGDRFKVMVVKDDEIVLGYRRTLVYGAATGSDSGGFDP